jgi:peptidoglycan-N-acetylglucosamine deacetylase
VSVPRTTSWLTPDLVAERRASSRRERRRRRRVRRTVAVAVPLVLLFAGAVLAYRALPPPDDRIAEPEPRARPAVTAAPPVERGEPVDIGTAPLAPPSRVTPLLESTPIVVSAGTDKPQVALTFDDGPGPYTPKIARILRRAGAGATFFTLGSQIAGNSATVRAVADAGFEVADHTQTHPRLPSLSPIDRSREIEDAAAMLRNAGVEPAPLFRPPFGVSDRATRAYVRSRGLLMVLWSADTSDYTRPGVKAIVKRALAGARPGAIILMHDGGGDRSQTVRALPRILKGLEKKGLRPVTVTKLLVDSPPSRSQLIPPPVDR